MRFTQKAILDAARRFAGEGLINSGTLVQFHPAALAIEVVAPSAASHVAPAYPLAAEAPRLYGRYSVADACDAWLDWMANVLGVHYRYRVEWLRSNSGRMAARRTVAKAILAKLQEMGVQG